MNTWGENKGSMFFFSSSKLWNPIAAGRKRKEKERKQERENRETEVAVMRSNLWNSSSWKFRFCCFSPSPLVFRLEDMITSTSIYGTFIFFNSFFFFFSIIPNVVCYCCLFVMFGEKKSKREGKKNRLLLQWCIVSFSLCMFGSSFKSRHDRLVQGWGARCVVNHFVYIFFWHYQLL